MNNNSHIIPTFEDAMLNPGKYELNLSWIGFILTSDESDISTFLSKAQGFALTQRMTESMSAQDQPLVKLY